jgi:tripartite-type tricarboxylate transporter receptor subunit TctC
MDLGETVRKLGLTLLVIALSPSAAPAAQDVVPYPERPVRIISALAVGGAVDNVGRLIAAKLSENLQRQFIVENRLGAGGTVGYSYVAKAPRDGYTLLVAGSGYTIASVIYPIQYDPLHDITPIAQTTNSYYLLVTHPALPARSVRELVSLANAKPRQLNFGSGGVGSSVHFAMEMFALASQISLTHVPYKGSGPAMVDLISGELQVMMANTISAWPHVQSNRMRALGISSTKRSEAMPGIPTIAESGVQYNLSVWTGFFAPSGVSSEIMSKLRSELTRALSDPAIAKKMMDGGGERTEEVQLFTQRIKDEMTMNRRIAVARNIRVE